MKKLPIILALSLALTLGLALPSAAAPIVTDEGITVYADYMFEAFGGLFSVGVDFGIADGITIGGLVGYEEVLFEYGAFAVLGLGPIAINAELVTTSRSNHPGILPGQQRMKIGARQTLTCRKQKVGIAWCHKPD